MVRIRPSTVAVSAASIPRPAKKCHETKTELEFGESLAAHRRAILLICFLYDNPAFQVQPSRHDATVKAQVSRAIKQGVESGKSTSTSTRPASGCSATTN